MDNREENSNTRSSEIGIHRGTENQIIGFPQEPPPPYSPTDVISSSPVPSTHNIIHQTIIVHQSLKDVPTYFNCPSCHKRVLTTVQFVNSNKTHMLAGFICGLTLCCMLCCLSALPYMITSFKTADHYCSNCNYYLGSYSKI